MATATSANWTLRLIAFAGAAETVEPCFLLVGAAFVEAIETFVLGSFDTISADPFAARALVTRFGGESAISAVCLRFAGTALATMIVKWSVVILVSMAVKLLIYQRTRVVQVRTRCLFTPLMMEIATALSDV